MSAANITEGWTCSNAWLVETGLVLEPTAVDPIADRTRFDRLATFQSPSISVGENQGSLRHFQSGGDFLRG